MQHIGWQDTRQAGNALFLLRESADGLLKGRFCFRVLLRGRFPRKAHAPKRRVDLNPRRGRGRSLR
ncbi:MAG: hypothetical protein ACK55I_03775, partial [bacterium]